jgi:hypothetical protein
MGSLATSSFKRFTDCYFNFDLSISYPDNIVIFENCVFNGTVSGTTSSNGNVGVYFNNCYFTSTVTFNSACKNIFINGGYIVGDVSFGSGGGVFNPSKAIGNVTQSTVDSNYFKNVRKQLVGSAAPTGGTYSIGDIKLNNVPSEDGFIGWTCVQAGSPGVWKGYGRIDTASKNPIISSSTSQTVTIPANSSIFITATTSGIGNTWKTTGVTSNIDRQGVYITSAVTGTNTVSFKLENPTASPITLTGLILTSNCYSS